VNGKQKGNAISRGLRVNRHMMDRVIRAAADGGFSNSSAFIRSAIERGLAGRESGVESAEARIAASLDRLLREVSAASNWRKKPVRVHRCFGQNAPDVSGRTAPRYVRSSH
jgi:hypothetical protein